MSDNRLRRIYSHLLRKGEEHADFFQYIPLLPRDEIFASMDKFKSDRSPLKVMLSIGVYRTEEGTPYTFECIKEAEKIWQKNRDYEYRSEMGDEEFAKEAAKLVFGARSPHLDRIASCQTLAGTGAVYFACVFVLKCCVLFPFSFYQQQQQQQQQQRQRNNCKEKETKAKNQSSHASSSCSSLLSSSLSSASSSPFSSSSSSPFSFFHHPTFSSSSLPFCSSASLSFNSSSSSPFLFSTITSSCASSSSSTSCCSCSSFSSSSSSSSITLLPPLTLLHELQQKYIQPPFVLFSSPTWINYPNICEDLRVPHRAYHYFDSKNYCIDISNMMRDLEEAPSGSVIILQACGHNPTGMDLSHDQWKQVAALMKRKHHFPIFDLAYQGFVSGDLDRDAWAVRYFADEGFDLIACQSFSKNLGLYGDRVGSMHIVTSQQRMVPAVSSQLSRLARALYSSPPLHGAELAKIVMTRHELVEMWRQELERISERLKRNRQMLSHRLEQLGTPGTWSHYRKQKGMFGYGGLTREQCQILTEKFHIYLPQTGRICFAGINQKNVDYVSRSIDAAVRMTQQASPV
eukprot:TRINITY_DN1410_c0_g1_i2.p1 TRINITY_DN1410_c0_g1~~TRINITY_DN1410_c0_g1_i2.p1  ORF type:complete len:573 (-),score=164.11 TRINITY_DN1410_c0_g1_i2:509-2227(-)